MSIYTMFLFLPFLLSCKLAHRYLLHDSGWLKISSCNLWTLLCNFIPVTSQRMSANKKHRLNHVFHLPYVTEPMPFSTSAA